MAFQLSPGVNVSEIDLTTIVPAVGTTQGAFAGDFVWGPANIIVPISNEVELVNTFGKPDSNTYLSFFSAANFLAYTNTLRIVRAVANTVNNAVSGGTGLFIPNRDVYEESYLDIPNSNSYGMFAARYPGSLGNSLKVSLWASSNSTAYTSWAYYDQFDSAPSTSSYVAGVNGSNDEIHIIVIDEGGRISGTSNTVLEKFAYVSKAYDAKNDDGSSNYYVNVINERSNWIYIINHAKVNSGNVASIGITGVGNNYSNGNITFTAGSNTTNTVATGFYNVNTTGAIVSVTLLTGGSGYLSTDTVVANVSNSNFAAGGGNVVATLVANVGFFSIVDDTGTWGSLAANQTFSQNSASYTYSLANGTFAMASEGTLELAYDKFANAEEVDVSLIIGGAHSSVVQQHIIDNIVTVRKDAVAFMSPAKANVVNNTGSESTKIIAYKEIIGRSSSYAVMDGNWKYQFDKYNNVYRWVPLNADIAGLCARTDTERDAWFSPAGFNRGQIKNVVKLAWNPTKSNRDDLYKAGINPVVSFPGEGPVLFGDKTMLSKPSAFDRINVRRLFIVLEKAISRAARFSLFEFNDEFTRAQFVALIEPFLRDVQGRRGIFDFRVVCDTTNNTPEVIDRSEFVGDIYIKPARSINFIQLNFVAVRTGVAFEEIVGRF